jgi:hypothetical protein
MSLAVSITHIVCSLAVLFTLIFSKKIVEILDKREEKKKEKEFYLKYYASEDEKKRAS